MIAIVDYGVGNLFSLRSSLRALGAETEVTRDAGRLRAAGRIILPGVGAFGDAREKLEGTGLVPVLREEAEALLKQPVRITFRVGEPKAGAPQENLKNLLAFGRQFDNIEIKE